MNRELIGVLLVNLGTPLSFAPKDVKRYLKEFLTDKRVIDLPYLPRQLLVRNFIVPKRYRESAALYKNIWTAEGSPLLAYSLKFFEALKERVKERFCIQLAMRYQSPSIATALTTLEKKSLTELIVLPLFPQFSTTTTGSVHAEVMKQLRSWSVLPKLTFIRDYATHPAFISALSDRAAPYSLSSYDRILFSYHGLPKRYLKKIDRKNYCLKSKNCCHTLTEKNHHCYAAQCAATTRLLAKKLKLSADSYTLCYQSRLGKEPWLSPYTIDTILQCARKGEKKLLVFCPSFVADCLETLSEIGQEYKSLFLQAGGDTLDLVPGLNDHPAWVDAAQELLFEHSTFARKAK